MPFHTCPHCQTQNFYTRERARLAVKVPLVCWKCGKSVKAEGEKLGEGTGRNEPRRRKKGGTAG